MINCNMTCILSITILCVFIIEMIDIRACQNTNLEINNFFDYTIEEKKIRLVNKTCVLYGHINEGNNS
jgi:hypothetical protein